MCILMTTVAWLASLEILTTLVANVVTRRAQIHLMAITATFMQSKPRLPRNHSKCKTSLFHKPTDRILQKVSFNTAFWKSDQPRPQLNENGRSLPYWDQYRQGDKIYRRKDDTLVTDKAPIEARYHNLHKTHPQVVPTSEPTEDSDPFDWEYMTNGTGGCAKCGRRDVPLTASIEDGRLYAPECWDEYAWQWSYLNPNSIWRDNEHKSFTLTVEDIYRANNPRPFGYVKHDTEDIESLTDRSVDHMQNIPHTSHDEEEHSPTPNFSMTMNTVLTKT